MLGPSIVVASPPFCTGYALHACRRSGGRFAARFGLALAGVELLILAALMVIGLIAHVLTSESSY